MDIITLRRELHKIPELDRNLNETMSFLANFLSTKRCSIIQPIESSLCAFFDFGKKDTIAFRSDADALPITEQTGAEYASTHPGIMHACGHDAHMAMLLDLADWLDKQDTLPHNVLLVFQPAEETTGGAKDICESGIFKQYHVACIFGMHLWPDLPAGTIASRNNEMMSRSCEVHVSVTGRSSHIAKAEEGLDALNAAVQFYQRTMEMERSLPDSVFRLLKFGKMVSGTVGNAVSDHTMLDGSLRAFQDDIFFSMRDSLYRIAEEIQQETQCKVEVNTSEGYPAVLNPHELYSLVENSGISFLSLEKPVMITEDFSWYQRYLPGMFFFLGCGPSPALHADDFHFDESILSVGSDFWKKLASTLLF